MPRNKGGAGIGRRSADLRLQMGGQRGRMIALIFQVWCITGWRASTAACGLRPVACVPVASIPVQIERGGIDIERGIGFALARQHEIIAGRGFSGIVIAAILFAAYLPSFEQRIAFQRVADETLDFQIGQRQQLDRLLQLRRHHQRLRLPKIEAWT